MSLTLREDGSIHVAERQVVDFRGGPFSGAFAEIPTARIDAIRAITVSEETEDGVLDYEFMSPSDYDEDANTFTASQTSTGINIDWSFPRTVSQERTFLLEYEVYGALRVYLDNDPPNQQIWWTAIGSDVTEIAPVRESTVTITLPRAVELSEVRIGEEGLEDPAEYTDDGQVFTWQRSDLDAGDQFDVRLQVPPVVNAPPPSWQQADDERRRQKEKDEERGAVLNSIFLAIGGLFAVLGGVGVYGLWYTRGRDPFAGLVADFIPKPPDDLPPGAAGALVDEIAHERDIVATLVDLGHRGVIKLEETEQSGILGIGGSRDFNITLLQPEAATSPFEKYLIEALFGRQAKAEATATLSSVKSRFTSAQPAIKNALYDELVKRGYFTRSPEATRSSWRTGGLIGLVVVIVGGCVGTGAIANIAPLIWLPVIVAGAVAFAVFLLAPHMPRKTQSGSEAAAKWRAFKRYLEDIDRYEKLAEAKGIFDTYLPYAVAFGVEQSWVKKFAGVGTETPAWYGGSGSWVGDPFDQRRRYGRRGGTVIIDGGSGGGWSGGGNRGGGGGIDFPGMPDLQDTSDSAGRSLQRSSDGLFDMLNTAAKVFGGFSGGGRSSGGWGGSRGFGGGGSRGGSSGGGSRGFR